MPGSHSALLMKFINRKPYIVWVRGAPEKAIIMKGAGFPAA